MIIEGPYDPASDIANLVGVLLVKDYEKDPNARFQLHFAFYEYLDSVAKGTVDDKEVLVLMADDSLEQSDRITGADGLAAKVEYEIIGLKQAQALLDDPRYKDARGFQIDPSCTVYHVIPYSAITEDSLRLRVHSHRVSETTLPWRSSSGP
jgi:hypothetical protein